MCLAAMRRHGHQFSKFTWFYQGLLEEIILSVLRRMLDLENADLLEGESGTQRVSDAHTS